MRKASRKTLVIQLDRTVSNLVRQKQGGACEKCGRPANQVHHIVRRKYQRVRWDERNLVSVCQSCHDIIEGNLLAFSVWLKRHRPADFDYLADPENTKPIRRPDYELRELLEELRGQLLEEAA